MQHVFMNDEEREETVIERRDRERLETGKIDNDELIPLIPNVKQDVRKTVHCLQIWKMDPPGDGYKGDVPTTATIETIAKLYGNGTYDIHAVSPEGKVLRRSTGIRVAWVAPAPPVVIPADPGPRNDYEAHLAMLKWQAEQHQRDTQRVQDFGQQVINVARDNSQQHLTAMERQQNAQTERDRNFFQGLLQQQQVFFANMMQEARQSHQQQMERSNQEFNRTIQIVQLSNDRVSKATDPTLYLSALQQGLQLAANFQSPNDDEDDESEQGEPWAEAIRVAGEAVKDITEVAKAKAIAVRKDPPVSAPTPAASLPSTTQAQPKQTVPAKKLKKKLPFTREELAEIVRAKKIMDQKGLDFAGTVRNATQYILGGIGVDASESENHSQAESNESEESEESDSEESGPTEVDGS